MKKSFLISILAIAILSGIGAAIYFSVGKSATLEYQFSEITRGDVESTVSSTGTINPISKVEIGTQVSGTIARLYIDFNDHVRKGQLLAILDTIPLQTSVLSAQASVDKAKAQLDQYQEEYTRSQALFEKALLSEAEFLPYKTNIKMQQATLKSAQADLQRARTNLKYAYIRSPINGTVIQRSVEEGQTVAASLSTPTLFIIAEDLSKMEIDALVDESDIGLIKEGLPIKFEVPAYPGKKIAGTMQQIRLQPTTVSNVVNYTVVIYAENKDNLLLPGMTATIDFVTGEKKDVLLIPNAALRFQPSTEAQAEFRKNREAAAQADSSAQGQKKDGASKRNGKSGRTLPNDMGRLWFINKEGKLDMRVVKIGLTDGKNTELVSGRDVQEGMQVITSSIQSGQQKTQKSSSTLGGSPGGGPPPRGF
ncbi:MAG: efflux RND transporter periplasmic adaptor subunit [Chlorobiales bacterium]|jgi:HlyD family secretion protein|nr:efflux RND transporter periplasmic adaptor subunit [Chlorobiales bacterium]